MVPEWVVAEQVVSQEQQQRLLAHALERQVLYMLWVPTDAETEVAARTTNSTLKETKGQPLSPLRVRKRVTRY